MSLLFRVKAIYEVFHNPYWGQARKWGNPGNLIRIYVNFEENHSKLRIARSIWDKRESNQTLRSPLISVEWASAHNHRARPALTFVYVKIRLFKSDQSPWSHTVNKNYVILWMLYIECESKFSLFKHNVNLFDIFKQIKHLFFSSPRFWYFSK